MINRGEAWESLSWMIPRLIIGCVYLHFNAIKVTADTNVVYSSHIANVVNVIWGKNKGERSVLDLTIVLSPLYLLLVQQMHLDCSWCNKGKSSPSQLLHCLAVCWKLNSFHRYVNIVNHNICSPFAAKHCQGHFEGFCTGHMQRSGWKWLWGGYEEGWLIHDVLDYRRTGFNCVV